LSVTLLKVRAAGLLVSWLAVIRKTQWKGINCKQITRWQHLSQLKASAFFSLKKIFTCYETQQLILGTGTAIWWVTESHCTKIFTLFSPIPNYKSSISRNGHDAGCLKIHYCDERESHRRTSSYGATSLGRTTFSITTLRTIALNIKTLNIQYNDTQHNGPNCKSQHKWHEYE
jgi:hypothetical protein